MQNRRYNGKIVIWDSKIEHIIVAVICVIFTVGAIWTHEKYSTLGFLGMMLFFGGGGIFMIFQLVSPRYIYVRPTSELGKKILAEWFPDAL